MDYQEQLLQAIEERLLFEGRESTENAGDEYHIGYGIDNNYARCLGASIASICLHNQKKQLVFHVLANGLDQNNKGKIQQLARQFGVNIYLYLINVKIFNQLPTQEHLPAATYFRFILPIVLEVPRMLYIDADIICLGDIGQLFALDMEENVIAAVPDEAVIAHKRNIALDLQDHTYFNAGVLVIDRENWTCNNVFSKVIAALAAEPQKFRYLDQDALNLILTGKIYYLDKAWNRINSAIISNEDKTILLHFAAHPKPWSIAWPISKVCNAFTKDIYREYEAITPWKDCHPLLPHNYKEMKVYAKCLFRQGEYIHGIKWYTQYVKTKVFG